MQTAVIYARYSSDSQNEQSIEGQLRVCEEYAKRNGILILNTYIDRAMTGRNDNRPDFQRMLKTATEKNGTISLYISKKFFSSALSIFPFFCFLCETVSRIFSLICFLQIGGCPATLFYYTTIPCVFTVRFFDFPLLLQSSQFYNNLFLA